MHKYTVRQLGSCPGMSQLDCILFTLHHMVDAGQYTSEHLINLILSYVMFSSSWKSITAKSHGKRKLTLQMRREAGGGLNAIQGCIFFRLLFSTAEVDSVLPGSIISLNLNYIFFVS